MPIIYTTTAFCSTFDMGAFPLKTPFEDLMIGTTATEIDERIAPIPGIDTLIVKKRPSAFANALGRFLTISVSIPGMGAIRSSISVAVVPIIKSSNGVFNGKAPMSNVLQKAVVV